jgi:ADP-ribose pyrophosphatase YjhB (NUDIX family)
MKNGSAFMLLEKGNWSEKIAWELYVGTKLPPAELCTAAFCLAINNDRKIVLMRAERGWSLLGGHIEEGETVEEAVIRESQEEGGFTPDQLQQFAFRKIISSEPIPHQDPRKT